MASHVLFDLFEAANCDKTISQQPNSQKVISASSLGRSNVSRHWHDDYLLKPQNLEVNPLKRPHTVITFDLIWTRVSNPFL